MRGDSIHNLIVIFDKDKNGDRAALVQPIFCILQLGKYNIHVHTHTHAHTNTHTHSPTDAVKNLEPILESLPTADATCVTSAPVDSHSAEMALMLDTR